MTKKYFVYGTLMRKNVVEALGLRFVTAQPATLKEATLYKSDTGRYPFLVETHDPRDSVKGLLVTFELINNDRNITVDEILDFYEGAYGQVPLYNREERNGVHFYVANRGNPQVLKQLTPDNLIGGDWNEFSKRPKV